MLFEHQCAAVVPQGKTHAITLQKWIFLVWSSYILTSLLPYAQQGLQWLLRPGSVLERLEIPHKRFPRDQSWVLVGKPVYRFPCSSLEVMRECNCIPLSSHRPWDGVGCWTGLQGPQLIAWSKAETKDESKQISSSLFSPSLIACLFHLEIMSLCVSAVHWGIILSTSKHCLNTKEIRGTTAWCLGQSCVLHHLQRSDRQFALGLNPFFSFFSIPLFMGSYFIAFFPSVSLQTPLMNH